jgi:hypothetical protein
MKKPCLSLVAVFAGQASAEEKCRPLFNGKDLSGWETFLSIPDKSWDVPGMQKTRRANTPRHALLKKSFITPKPY